MFLVSKGAILAIYYLAFSSALELFNISPSSERFLCGGYTLGAKPGPEGNRQTKVCKPGPYQFVRIFDADVKMGSGKEDGTDDDVMVITG